MNGNNIMLGYPNRADGATVSGGSWLTNLPAANVASRELWQVARSEDCLPASTQFSIELPAAKELRVFALVNHNLSASATWRVTLGTAAGGDDVWDSGWKSVWTMSFDSFVEWGSSVWWGIPGGDEYLRSPFYAVTVAPDTFSVKHLTIEISDPANADGYVQIGRVFAGGVLQPTYNAALGLEDIWRDLTTVEMTDSGALWCDEKRKLRSVSFVLPYIESGEAAYYHEMLRQVGTSGEVLYVPYPMDPSENQRYGFLGRLSELSPLAYPYCRARSLPLKIEELG